MSDSLLSDLQDILMRVEETKTVSLPQFTKTTNLQSPIFIQDNLLEEDIVSDIIKNLYNIYTGYIFSALNMTSTVGNRTIRDILETVSTDTNVFGATEEYLDTKSIISGFEPALESSSRSGRKDTLIDKSSNVPIASGRIIEVQFPSGTPGENIIVPMLVKFNPRIIPNEVVEYIITTEFKQSFHQRWLQLQAGELRFFRDFIMQLDTLSKRSSALKQDKGGALGDLFRYQNKSSLRQILKFVVGNNRTFNLANAVLMLDESTVVKFSKKQGVDLRNLSDRRRFFAKTYSLFVVLVDSNYSQVTIFTNGIDDVAQYSFAEIKSSAGRDDFDLSEIMKAFGKSQTPTF